MTEQNVWTEITSTLNALNDDALSSLLASSQQLYDGNYIIAAEPEAYSSLCQYFPLIETVVQDHSGRHFRLNLQASVPMGTDADTLHFQPGLPTSATLSSILKGSSPCLPTCSVLYPSLGLPRS
jgi:hypothetical protein